MNVWVCGGHVCAGCAWGRGCLRGCVCVGVRVVCVGVSVGFVLMGVAVVRGLVGAWLRDMDEKNDGKQWPHRWCHARAYDM